MASRCLRANLFHLPPALRTSIYTNVRTFSSTPQRKLDIGSDTLTSVVVSGPTAVLDAVHSLGLPWCAAIPVTALLVRGVFGYYASARPARKRALTRLNLYPIIHARYKAMLSHKMAVENERRRSQKNNGVNISPAVYKFQDMIMSMITRIQANYYVGKAYGAGRSWQNWINFAVFIAFAEAVRIKCGAREGLLTLLLGPLQGKETPATVLSPEEALAERLAAAREAAKSRQEPIVSSDTVPDGNLLAIEHQLPRLNTPAYADLKDPTMTLEGFSWAQDLSVPDSTWMLPAALGFFMVANTLLRPSFKKESGTVKDIQEKLKALDESLENNRAATGTPKSSSRVQAELPKIQSATDDVVHALQVAEKLNMEVAEKKKKTSTDMFLNLSFGKRLGVAFAFYLSYAAIHFPAGVVLYMLTSLGVGWLQTRWLDVKYPVRPPIRPCRRPMRYKVKQEYNET